MKTISRWFRFKSWLSSFLDGATSTALNLSGQSPLSNEYLQNFSTPGSEQNDIDSLNSDVEDLSNDWLVIQNQIEKAKETVLAENKAIITATQIKK